MTLNIFHLWAEHVMQPSEGPLEGDPSEEEDGEDHVGEDGCHVHHVARRGDTLNIEDGQEKSVLSDPDPTLNCQF